MYTEYTDSRQKIVDTSTSPSCLSQYDPPIGTFCAEENMCRITQHTCITSYIHICTHSTHTCRQTSHWPSVPYLRIVYIHIPPSFYTYISTLYPRSLDLEYSFFSSFDPNSQISYFRYGTSLPLQSIGSHHARERLKCFFLLFFLMRMEFSSPLSWAELSWTKLTWSCLCICAFHMDYLQKSRHQGNWMFCLPDHYIVVKPRMNGDFNILVVLSCLGLFRIQMYQCMSVSYCILTRKKEKNKHLSPCQTKPYKRPQF